MQSGQKLNSATQLMGVTSPERDPGPTCNLVQCTWLWCSEVAFTALNQMVRRGHSASSPPVKPLHCGSILRSHMCTRKSCQCYCWPLSKNVSSLLDVQYQWLTQKINILWSRKIQKSVHSQGIFIRVMVYWHGKKNFPQRPQVVQGLCRCRQHGT